MISTALTDLWYGFGVALEPHNLMYCFLGVLVGNLVGVLPGMGPVATISILLPLTFGMHPVPAILMLSGVYYGAQYGGAICSILLNLPCHPPHAVTCLDGFPLTKQGKGGTALGITVIAAFIGASFGITEMIFLAPFLVKVALEFGPAEVCSLMLVGLLAGSTLFVINTKNAALSCSDAAFLLFSLWFIRPNNRGVYVEWKGGVNDSRLVLRSGVHALE